MLHSFPAHMVPALSMKIVLYSCRLGHASEKSWQLMINVADQAKGFYAQHLDRHMIAESGGE